MSFRKKAAILLMVIGPGLITSNIDNDAGGIATYSIAGAHFGYAFLWTLLPITVALIVVQEMCARMGVVTGKGLADLIRENYGIRITFWLMVFLFLTDLGNTAAEFSGLAASLELFGVSKYISVPLGAVFIWLLVVKGTYILFERIFLVVCLAYFTYIVSAIMAKPDWTQVAIAAVKPSFYMDSSYLSMLVGIVGTTIAPWMLFYLQSAVVEKKIKKNQYWATRVDVIIGSIMTNVVAFFIIVACGATLFKAGIRIRGAEDAALALAPFAGKYATALFAIGLANASLFSACILPLATSYYICEAMGWEAGVDRNFKEAPQFLGIYTALIVLGVLIILIPGVPLISVMWISQVINGVMLPFVLIFVLYLINKSDLMNEYVNSSLYNSIAWSTVGIVMALTVAMLVTMFL
ncbi:MAG: Nramp family divalent metal transporter [Deltaproteobacteria bacterium]|nr:Nramp family divalent metal transporter [Deltaproteobacteria bacterium]